MQAVKVNHPTRGEVDGTKIGSTVYYLTPKELQQLKAAAPRDWRYLAARPNSEATREILNRSKIVV